MFDDKYMEWLVERKIAISKIEDDVIKKFMVGIHDDYAENYIIMKKLEKTEKKEGENMCHGMGQQNDKKIN